jgi:hypothetical protein
MTKVPFDKKEKDNPSQEGREILDHLRRLEKTLGPKPQSAEDDEDGETKGNTPPSLRASRETVEARMRKRLGTV